MKKLSSFLLMLAMANICYAQPDIYRAGPANTVIDWRLGAGKNFILPRFDNLQAADADIGLDHEGAMIYNKQNNTIYYRQMTPRAWVKIMSSSNGGSGSCGLSAGGLVTWSGSGLTYDVTSAAYCINDNGYFFGGGSVSLAPNPGVDSRFDVIALDNTGSVIVLQGKASANPQIPTVDPATQLLLTAILVNTSGGSDPGVQTVLWNENTSYPEWDATSSNMTVDFNSVDNPYNGSVTGWVSDLTTGANIVYTGDAKLLSSYNALKFYLNINPVDAFSNAGITVQLLTNGNQQVTLPLQINQAFGFDKYLNGVYQNVTIPLSAFTYMSDPQYITGIQFYFGNEFRPGFLLDYITLQGGVTTPGNSGNFITNVWRKAGTDSVFKTINGVDLFAFIDTVGAGGGGSTDAVTNVWRKTGTDSVFQTINGVDQFAFKDTINTNFATADLTIASNRTHIVSGTNSLYLKSTAGTTNQDSTTFRLRRPGIEITAHRNGAVNAADGFNNHKILANEFSSVISDPNTGDIIYSGVTQSKSSVELIVANQTNGAQSALQLDTALMNIYSRKVRIHGRIHTPVIGYSNGNIFSGSFMLIRASDGTSSIPLPESPENGQQVIFLFEGNQSISFTGGTIAGSTISEAGPDAPVRLIYENTTATWYKF